MTVTNKLVSKSAKNEREMTFSVNGAEIKLTPAIVKNYLVSGNSEAVTDQEIMMFMSLCKFQKLNPWLKEAYCIKYGTSPATVVIGKEAFMKRAESQEDYDGFEAGIIIASEDGYVYRKGAFYDRQSETVVGGWAEVYRKTRKIPYRIEVSFDEYAGRTKDGKLNSQWATKPATMIRKVALVQALREAFPQAFAGLYSAEEQGEVEANATVVPNEDVVEAQDQTRPQEEQQHITATQPASDFGSQDSFF